MTIEDLRNAVATFRPSAMLQLLRFRLSVQGEYVPNYYSDAGGTKEPSLPHLVLRLSSVERETGAPFTVCFTRTLGVTDFLGHSDARSFLRKEIQAFIAHEVDESLTWEDESLTLVDGAYETPGVVATLAARRKIVRPFDPHKASVS